MEVYQKNEILEKLNSLEGWNYSGETITKTYEAASFHRGIGFVAQIGILADKADHHPDLTIQYNKITVSLATHSANGITEKDFSLAEQIEKAFAQ
ncbi:MAG: 4a-hydroxytetrahydrobiopterin dehydratase [Ectothiorhodospiraceae bacterium]|nr:4a-hydroxytetrahydrobiopterin dehydratase [Ectothiorhodospiraceae bacterium]